MKILLTGATGYIGKRLLPSLVNAGHEVVCGVREPKRMEIPNSLLSSVSLIQMDLLNKASLDNIPADIDIVFYLVHSMSTRVDYSALEMECAVNMREALENTKVKQVIYLSGIVNEEVLSDHLSSRLAVEVELSKGSFPLTTLRSGIIIGSGSASFEIIRDLVEKLPIMVAPKWLRTRCQPIGISDVIKLLTLSIGNPKLYNRSFDIGGPDIMTYKDMLLGFAKQRNLKRYIFIVPIMTPKLSSYWLYFVTSTSYMLARALVDSMKIEVICRDNSILEILDVTPISFMEALEKAFHKIKIGDIASSWKDAMVNSRISGNLSNLISVPTHGCFVDERMRPISDIDSTKQKVWSIGGKNGWYAYQWLWTIRGYMDKLVGGVGLRRGRTNVDKIESGDALDFWRVLHADYEEGRLLLFAEMKLPGEAWLDFSISNGKIIQTATFRPRGLWGRLYWYSVLPFHGIIFSKMIDKLAAKK